MDDLVMFWKCLAAVLCALIVTVGGCTAHQNKVSADVLLKSPNPALVQCALTDERGKSSVFCVELARQK